MTFSLKQTAEDDFSDFVQMRKSIHIKFTLIITLVIKLQKTHCCGEKWHHRR